MAARAWNLLKILGTGRIVLAGSFAPAAAGAPTTVRGQGFTVTRTGVGTFSIALRDKYVELDSVVATVQLAAAANTFAQAGTVVTGTSANTIELRTLTAGAAADIAANANNRINFAAVIRNSSVVS